MHKSAVILTFSARKNGNCEQITNFIQTNTECSVETYRFVDFFIRPCGSCQYECFQDNLRCPHICDREFELLDAISHCKIAYFIVLNYCDYPCANFFIFNERSLCYFQNHQDRLERYLKVPKRFVVVSNSRTESFREAFAQHTHGEPEILWLSAKCYGKQSISGDILDSNEAKKTCFISFKTKMRSICNIR